MAGGEGTLPIEVEPRISEYLSLVMRLMFAFGVSFELPVILLLLTKAGIVTPKGLARNRKYAILIAFVAAAILTPPDVISQVMLAIPVIFFLRWHISIFISGEKAAYFAYISGSFAVVAAVVAAAVVARRRSRRRGRRRGNRNN